jgi:hypothetical protein
LPQNFGIKSAEWKEVWLDHTSSAWGEGMPRELVMISYLVPALDLVLDAQTDANASSKGNYHSNYLRNIWVNGESGVIFGACKVLQNSATYHLRAGRTTLPICVAIMRL